MATSGTYGFTMTRDDIIAGALRLVGAYDPSESIPQEDITTCAVALNLLVKDLARNELPLWCVVDVSVPLLTGVAAYDLSAASGTTLPLRVLDCYIRDAVGNDTQLTVSSRYDYDRLGNKSQPGVPNQVYYDPQLGAGMLYVYNVPADDTHTLHVVIQRQLQDFNLATDTPDFPQEAFRLLKWCLADEVALEYQTPAGMRQEIAARASHLRENYAASLQEQVSVRFTPGMRVR
jgi:hypothetical protein